MSDYKAPGSEWFEKMELTPPVTTPHGTDGDIRENLKPLKTWGWKLEGNQLKCTTDMGELCQTIGTGYILTGEDDKGMPLLRRIDA